MESRVPGTPNLEVEVTNISRHGFWILLGDWELFLPFEIFHGLKLRRSPPWST